MSVHFTPKLLAELRADANAQGVRTMVGTTSEGHPFEMTFTFPFGSSIPKSISVLFCVLVPAKGIPRGDLIQRLIVIHEMNGAYLRTEQRGQRPLRKCTYAHDGLEENSEKLLPVVVVEGTITGPKLEIGRIERYNGHTPDGEELVMAFHYEVGAPDDEPPAIVHMGFGVSCGHDAYSYFTIAREPDGSFRRDDGPTADSPYDLFPPVVAASKWGTPTVEAQ